MQQNFPFKHKSQLIKYSEETKLKAKRRLIGSVVLLLIALIILLNVTSKIKTIPVNPQIITINNKINTSQNVAQNSNQSENATGQIAPATSSTPTTVQQVINPEQLNTPANNINSKQTASGATIQNANNLKIKPRVISTSITKHPSPEEILNGITEPITITSYYIQIATANDKDSLQQLKQKLSQEDIQATIGQIHTNNGIIYRLRVGPYDTQDDANADLINMLDTIQTIQEALTQDLASDNSVTGTASETQSNSSASHAK